MAVPISGNLLAHFDASDIDSITIVDGKISQWNDLSGNDYHVAQSDVSRRPEVNSNLNDMQTVRFGGGIGNYHYLESGVGYASGLTDATIVAVVKGDPEEDSRNGHWFLADQAPQNHFGAHPDDAASRQGEWYSSFGGNTRVLHDTQAIDVEWCRPSLRRAGSTIVAGMDGIEGTDRSGGSVSWWNVFTLGQNRVGYPWLGWIAEVLLYNKSLSSEELSSVNTYLYNKWFAASSATFDPLTGQLVNPVGGYE